MGVEMIFINEFVSDQDVDRYKLKEIWDSFRPFQKNTYDDPGFRFTWTVAKEDNVFLMRAISGREELSNQVTFVLGIEGELVNAVLASAPESSVNLREGVGRVIWQLVRLEIPSALQTDKSRIEAILKEALLEYGYRGILRAVPQYQVSFAF
jgi:hypothetical protein